MKLLTSLSLVLAFMSAMPVNASASYLEPYRYSDVRGSSIHTVRANKFEPSHFSLNVFGVYSRVLIRCTKGEVRFVNQPAIVSGDQQLIPLRTHVRNLREGDMVEIELGGYRYDHRGRWYEHQVEVNTLELDIESPNLIGSRGMLEIQFIR
ncbi:MAG: hypothetical protein ACLGGX_07430 [Bdellovibrionia bacterium]